MPSLDRPEDQVIANSYELLFRVHMETYGEVDADLPPGALTCLKAAYIYGIAHRLSLSAIRKNADPDAKVMTNSEAAVCHLLTPLFGARYADTFPAVTELVTRLFHAGCALESSKVADDHARLAAALSEHYLFDPFAGETRGTSVLHAKRRIQTI